MFLFVTICIYYSIDLLRSFIVDTKFYSFSLMTEKIAGKNWLRTYGISSFIVYLSMIVDYESWIYSYIESSKLWDIEGFKNTFRVLFYIGICIVEIVVCVCTRNTKLHLLSIITLACLTVILLLIIFFSLNEFLKNDLIIPEGKELTSLFPRKKDDESFMRFLNIISKLVTFVFGYCYHSTFPTLIGNLYTVNNITTKKVHIYSFSIIFVFFLLISFFGCLYEISIGECDIEVLFIDNLQETSFPEGLRLPLAIFFFTLIPIRFMVVRDSYTTLIGQKKITLIKEVILTAIFFVVTSIIGFLVNSWDRKNRDKVTNFLKIFGSFFGVIICFLLPVINYVSVVGKTKVKSIIGYIITGIFLIVCIITQIDSFYQLINGNDEK